MDTKEKIEIFTLKGKLPKVREIKGSHGEASRFEATLRTISGKSICKLDFGYGKKEDKAHAEHLVKCWNAFEEGGLVEKLVKACEGGIKEPILVEYLDWAKHMKQAPNLAVYKQQFGALCALLNDLITHRKQTKAALAAAKEKKQ